MKKFLLDFFNNFKSKGAKHKVLVITIAVMYLFIACVCLIHVECDYTSPGDINRVGNVIELENTPTDVTNSKIFTVSVYTNTKISLAQYFIAKYLDKNIDVEIVDHDKSSITVNEQNKIDACAKQQSIQDSIIVAYNYAKEEGKDVNLEYSYGGVVVCVIPSNYYGTGPESLMIGDIVKSIGDVEITSMDVFREIVEGYYDQYLENGKSFSSVTIPTINVIRDGKEVTLNACSSSVVIKLGNYSKQFKDKNYNNFEYYFYDYYNINYETSKPKIEISKTYSVGPSGGLMQAIYVYNAITGGEIAKDKYLVGTGTISTDGSVGEIGSIQQKIVTASIYLSDYFFVADENYLEALEAYNKLKNPTFKLIKVEKFEDAIKALQEKEGE